MLLSSGAMFPFQGLEDVGIRDGLRTYGRENKFRDDIGVDLLESTVAQASIINLVETVNKYAILYSKVARRKYIRRHTLKQRKAVVSALRNQPLEIFNEVSDSIVPELPRILTVHRS